MEQKNFFEKIIPVRDSKDELIVRIYFPEKEGEWDYKCRFNIIYKGKSRGLTVPCMYEYDALMHTLFVVGTTVRGIIKEDKIRLDLEGNSFDTLFPLPEEYLKSWDDCDHLFKPPFQE